MATPSPAKRSIQFARDSTWLYFAYVVLVTALAIVLMVVPGQEINEVPADAKLQLDTTFSDLVRHVYWCIFAFLC